MRTVNNICGKCGAKIPDDTTRELCPACLLETGLGLLDDENEDTISHARLPHGEVGWDPSRPMCASKRLLPHWQRSSYSSFLTKEAKSKLTDIEGPEKERATRQRLN
jgi:hypothetical protein